MLSRSVFPCVVIAGLMALPAASAAVEGSGTLPPARVGLAPRPSWIGESNQGGAFYGYSVGTAGDVNHDGFDDVIVGAPFFSTEGKMFRGRVYLYRGSPAGLSDQAIWSPLGDQAGGLFGYAVGSAGDVNGDGFADVVVGAAFYDDGQTDEGRVYVYYGSPSGPSLTPDRTAESDQASALFGSSVAGAGDVNHDGFDDLIVGAPLYDHDQMDEGRVFVYYGSPAGLSLAPDWTAEIDQDFAQFGFSVASAGDVNGDVAPGKRPDDVIVGAPQYFGVGAAFAYHGSSEGLSETPDWTVLGDQGGTLFGRSVGSAGRVNDDRFADVIVGAPSYDDGETDEGAAFAYYGSPTGLSPTPNWSAESNQDFAAFGSAVGSAGSVNGDKYDDVLVGAPSYDTSQTDAGAVLLYTGSATGLSPAPRLVVPSKQQASNLGVAVGTAGDVNRDGGADFIAGAWQFDHGQSDEGAAILIQGKPQP